MHCHKSFGQKLFTKASNFRYRIVHNKCPSLIITPPPFRNHIVDTMTKKHSKWVQEVSLLAMIYNHKSQNLMARPFKNQYLYRYFVQFFASNSPFLGYFCPPTFFENSTLGYLLQTIRYWCFCPISIVFRCHHKLGVQLNTVHHTFFCSSSMNGWNLSVHYLAKPYFT